MGKTTKKEKENFKKPKHNTLIEKRDKRHFNKDEMRDIRNATDPFYFEKFCGACMFFETEDCPYKGVLADTMWEEEIDCKKFFD